MFSVAQTNRGMITFFRDHSFFFFCTMHPVGSVHLRTNIVTNRLRVAIPPVGK